MSVNKNCVLYGKCQIVIHLYDKVKDFLEPHQVFPYVNNDRLNGLNIIELKDIDVEVLKNCSVFIYHPLNSKHGVYSSDHIMSFLPEDCIKISIPYVYNSSIYTVYWEPASPRWRIGTLYNCGWKNIMTMIKDGSDLNEILNAYEENALDFYFEERMKICIDSLKQKEENCTIKVSDFIIDNVRNKRLFFTQNHLSDFFTTYIANKVFKHLNITKTFEYPEYIESTIEQDCLLDRYSKSNFKYQLAYDDKATMNKIKDFYNFFINIKDKTAYEDIKPYTIKTEQPEKFIDHDL